MDTNKFSRAGMPWDDGDRIKLFEGKRACKSWPEIADIIGRKATAIQTQFSTKAYKGWAAYEQKLQQEAHNQNSSCVEHHLNVSQPNLSSPGLANFKEGDSTIMRAVSKVSNDASKDLVSVGGVNNSLSIERNSAREDHDRAVRSVSGASVAKATSGDTSGDNPLMAERQRTDAGNTNMNMNVQPGMHANQVNNVPIQVQNLPIQANSIPIQVNNMPMIPNMNVMIDSGEGGIGPTLERRSAIEPNIDNYYFNKHAHASYASPTLGIERPVSAYLGMGGVPHGSFNSDQVLNTSNYPRHFDMPQQQSNYPHNNSVHSQIRGCPSTTQGANMHRPSRGGQAVSRTMSSSHSMKSGIDNVVLLRELKTRTLKGPAVPPSHMLQSHAPISHTPQAGRPSSYLQAGPSLTSTFSRASVAAIHMPQVKGNATIGGTGSYGISGASSAEGGYSISKSRLPREAPSYNPQQQSERSAIHPSSSHRVEVPRPAAMSIPEAVQNNQNVAVDPVYAEFDRHLDALMAMSQEAEQRGDHIQHTDADMKSLYDVADELLKIQAGNDGYDAARARLDKLDALIEIQNPATGVHVSSDDCSSEDGSMSEGASVESGKRGAAADLPQGSYIDEEEAVAGDFSMPKRQRTAARNKGQRKDLDKGGSSGVQN